MLDWNPGPPSTAAGPCCGSKGPHSLVVSVANPWAPGEILHFYKCADCHSLIVPDGAFHDYSDAEPAQVSWRHYVQLGAGIDVMVNPAERARAPNASRLLDVGCGFGFTLDYWQHAVGGEAVGVEPSAFGRLGAKMLGVNLHVALLADVPSLQTRQFDVVLSSEVIEHVPDPAAFVRELQRHLAPGGTLVLTTPNAGFVTQDAPLGLVLATLSPGLHKLLLSRAALERLLGDAGFAHIRVDGAGQQLVAWASEKPLSLQDDPAVLRSSYVSYLGRRWADPSTGLDLRLGFGYRLFKELVNGGRLDEAVPVAAGLQALIQEHYKFDLTDRAAVLDAVLPTAQLDDYMAAAPFPLGPILFFRAIAAAQGALPGEDAAAGFALAHEVLAQSIHVRPDHFQEAATLAWAALLEQAGVLLRAGQAGAAASCLARIAAAETAPPAGCPTRVPADVAQRALALADEVKLALTPPASPAIPQPPKQRPRGFSALWQHLRASKENQRT